MSVTVTFNGTSYTIPSPGESAEWGTSLNVFLSALAGALGPTTNNTITVTSGKALKLQGDTTSPVNAAFCIVPQDTQPSGPNIVGDMYVKTSDSKLYICTVAGTPGTWATVGSQ